MKKLEFITRGGAEVLTGSDATQHRFPSSGNGGINRRTARLDSCMIIRATRGGASVAMGQEYAIAGLVHGKIVETI